MWFAFKRVRKIAASHQVCWWQWRLLAEFIGGILNADPKCWRVSCIGFCLCCEEHRSWAYYPPTSYSYPRYCNARLPITRR